MWTEEEAIKMAQQTIKLIIKAAREKNKLIVATGDVHQLLEEDEE